MTKNMDEQIIRSLQGRATLAEEERLRAWRRASPENERRYAEMRELWSLLAVAAPQVRTREPDAAALIDRAEASASKYEAPRGTVSREARRPASGLRARRIARAAFAAVLAAVAFGIGYLAEGPRSASFLAESEIVTGAGEMTTLTLADGSSIRLGPQSRLRLTESQSQRIAYLEGRAFFGVQSDSTRPFTVRTPHGEARVLGTRFEVRSEEAEEFRVLVVEGEVAVVAGGSELRLHEGELSRSVQGALVPAERVENVFNQLDWLGDALVFQATPFERALSEIGRRYGLAIDLRDPSLAQLTVTATFTGQPVEDVLFVLCEIASAPCLVDGDSVRIGRSGPSA